MTDRSVWVTLWPRLLHTVLTMGCGVVTYVATHNEAVTLAVLGVASLAAGEVVARVVKPTVRRRRRVKLPLPTTEHIEDMIAVVNGDVHELVDLLAAIRGWMALMKEGLRRMAKELQEHDEARRLP